MDNNGILGKSTGGAAGLQSFEFLYVESVKNFHLIQHHLCASFSSKGTILPIISPIDYPQITIS
jgi:hypothetical protein